MFLLEISSGDWEGLEDYIEDEIVSPVNQFFLVIMAIIIFCKSTITVVVYLFIVNITFY